MVRSVWVDEFRNLSFDCGEVVRVELVADGERLILRAKRHIALATINSCVAGYAQAEREERRAEVVPFKRKRRGH